MTWMLNVVALALVVLAVRSWARRVRASRQRAEAMLAEAGLQVSGDLLGTFVARPVADVPLELTNRTPQIRPGPSEFTDITCVVGVVVPLVDQIVCKAAEADIVMGPLPAAPRVRTGHAPFDERYAIFVGAAGEVQGGSYRAAPTTNDIPWAKAPVLDGLMDLDLLWLRVRDGQADLVFPALEIEDVARAATLAVAVEGATRGRPAPVPSRGPRFVLSPWRDEGTWLVIFWAGAVAVGIITAFVTDDNGGLHWLGNGLLRMLIVALVGHGVAYVLFGRTAERSAR